MIRNRAQTEVYTINRMNEQHSTATQQNIHRLLLMIDTDIERYYLRLIDTYPCINCFRIELKHLAVFTSLALRVYGKAHGKYERFFCVGIEMCVIGVCVPGDVYGFGDDVMYIIRKLLIFHNDESVLLFFFNLHRANLYDWVPVADQLQSQRSIVNLINFVSNKIHTIFILTTAERAG